MGDDTVTQCPKPHALSPLRQIPLHPAALHPHLLRAGEQRRIHQALERLMVNHTSFVISHRLSTVRRADRIYVLDPGKALEEGAHAELLAHGELYAELCRTAFLHGENEKDFPACGIKYASWQKQLIERRDRRAGRRKVELLVWPVVPGTGCGHARGWTVFTGPWRKYLRYSEVMEQRLATAASDAAIARQNRASIGASAMALPAAKLPVPKVTQSEDPSPFLPNC